MKKLMIFLLLATATLSAETVTNESQEFPIFRQYLEHHTTAKLYANACMMDENLGVDTKDPYTINLGVFGIYEPIEIQSRDLHPTKGVWAHQYEVIRGGMTRTYNVCFVANEEGEPLMVPLIMGKTKASPQLVDDVMMQVQMCAYLQLDNLEDILEEFEKTFFVIDSEEVGYEGESRIEKWLVRACGKEIPVVLTFTPDGMGGTYFAVSQK